MHRWKCIEKCFWNNVFYSPRTDGRQIYEGDAEPPKHKDGTPMFERLDPDPAPVIVKWEPEPIQPKVDAFIEENKPKPVTMITPEMMENDIQRWILNQMPKIDLQGIMTLKYKTNVPESVSRRDIIQMILNLQKDKPQTNQEIAREAGV